MTGDPSGPEPARGSLGAPLRGPGRGGVPGNRKSHSEGFSSGWEGLGWRALRAPGRRRPEFTQEYNKSYYYDEDDVFVYR